MAVSIDIHRLAVARADRRARRGEPGEGRDARGETVVIMLSDDTLLATLADLRWRLGALLESGPSTLLLDLSGVRRLSSATIAVFLWVRKRCSVRGVHLVVRRPSRRSIDVLRRTGLLSTLVSDDAERHGMLVVVPPGVDRRVGS